MRYIILKSFFFMFVYFPTVGGVTYATTLRIGPKESIKSLQIGLQKAQAGDTILVIGGFYEEGNLSITKPLTLIGIDRPVLDGNKKYEPVSIRSSHVSIEGFKVQKSGQSSMIDMAGIKIYNVQNVQVINNILDDNYFGIYAQGAKNCHIEGNHVEAYGLAEQLSGNGIHAWKCDSLTINNNTIKGHRDGIYLEFVTHTNSDNNLSINNIRYGLHFMFSHENAYKNNVFKHNGAGVAVMYTKNVLMEGNRFEENWGDAAYGLLLKDITDSKITGNYFSKNTTGIFMEGSNRLQIENNEFSGNGWALKIQASCMDNKLAYNNFKNNTFDVATNGSLMKSQFFKNYWDKYEGYDLNRDGIGDIPHRPVSLFSMVVEKYPTAMLLFRSFMVTLFDRTEKMIPSITPANLEDTEPLIKSIHLKLPTK